MPFSDFLTPIATGFNQALNPIRRAVGAPTSPLPPGVSDLDYLAIYDQAMLGFGGADPYRRPVSPAPTKLQDRVPQARSPLDMALNPQSSNHLARQLSGDMPTQSPFGTETAMKLMFHERALDAAFNQQPAPQPEPFSSAIAPSIPDAGVRRTTNPYEPPPQTIPIPKARPRPTEYTVKKGDNPWKIARNLGLTVDELERLNPGITRNAKRLKIGITLKL
jgi:nucleoid-associated protein YgaU